MQIRSTEDINKENKYFKGLANEYLPRMLSENPIDEAQEVYWRVVPVTPLHILTKPLELMQQGREKKSAIINMQKIAIDLKLEGFNARRLAKYLNEALRKTKTVGLLRGETQGQDRASLVVEEKNYGFSAQETEEGRYHLILRLPEDNRLPTTDIKTCIQEVLDQIQLPPPALERTGHG